MSEVAIRKENLPANGADYSNPFLELAEQANLTSIIGRLLKFSKGEYLVDDKDIPVGTELIANIDSMIHGWVKWQNQKPVEQLMGLVCNRFQIAKRTQLGDDDSTQWEVQQGKAVDPWAETYQIVLKDTQSEQLYTYSASSFGGRKAFVKLCESYGKMMGSHGDEWPVISLDVSSYVHDDYGKIKEPVLTITRWVPKSDFNGGQPELALEETTASSKTKF